VPQATLVKLECSWKIPHFFSAPHRCVVRIASGYDDVDLTCDEASKIDLILFGKLKSEFTHEKTNKFLNDVKSFVAYCSDYVNILD